MLIRHLIGSLLPPTCRTNEVGNNLVKKNNVRRRGVRLALEEGADALIVVGRLFSHVRLVPLQLRGRFLGQRALVVNVDIVERSAMTTEAVRGGDCWRW